MFSRGLFKDDLLPEILIGAVKRKIFVIERDENVLKSLIYCLKEQGYEVFSSNSEFGIFGQLERAKPDAILLDVVSATAQGTELCRAIKAAPQLKHIPVILPSMHLKTNFAKTVFTDEVLPKPFDIQKLNGIIEHQLVGN